MFRNRFGETPRTKIINLEKAMKVNVRCPDRHEILPRLRRFIGATWADTIAEAATMGEEEMLYRGSALWQGLELFDFFIEVEGITRILTHQIVRTRIGATYSQQCSGDADWRHHDLLMPRKIFQMGLGEEYILNSLTNKFLYAKAIDTKKISIQEARLILPQNLSTFIMMKMNLAALAPWVRKRSCSMTQDMSMVRLAVEIKNQVIASWPELEPLLADECSSGKCFWTQSMLRKDYNAHTTLYAPDTQHIHALMENSEYGEEIISHIRERVQVYNDFHSVMVNGVCNMESGKYETHDRFFIGMVEVGEKEWNAKS